ncbi:MAG TPA: c-type cytochrome [Bryobacteraceae bacterium]|nr:c-type cytochrome [Bryobacteraceae bacterium]
MRSSILLAAMLAATALFVCSCGNSAEHTAEVTTGGDARRGAAAISRYGCGACHVIPGVSGAQGLAGPPLSGIASRTYIAGVLQNTPENMMRWIENPPAVDEHTVMPNLHVTAKDAADIAGYLYTLK